MLWAQQGYGQLYRCFTPTAKQYFVNNYGYLKGMRIDSVGPAGNGAWRYHPFRTPRGASGTLDHKGGSWLGHNVVAQPNGDFLFFTTWGDTVLIKTQAQVGDQWRFLDDSSNRHYTAKLAAMEVMDVAGNTDSVKRITINAYLNGQPNPADSFDAVDIILSKHYGFAEVFDLYFFPYHAVNDTAVANDYYFRRSIMEPFDTLPGYEPASPFPATPRPGRYNSLFRQVALQNPSAGQMAAGLQPGDVLLYHTCEDIASLCPTAVPYRCHLDTVVSNTLPGLNRLVMMRGVEATFVDTGLYQLSPQNTLLSYHDTIPLFSTSLMPEEIRQPNFLYYYPDDTTYCRSGLKVMQVANFIRTNYTINTANSQYRIYKMGLGKMKSYNLSAGTVLDTTITYMESGGIACGSGGITPYTLSVAGNKPAAGIRVYPNPANDYLVVESADEDARLDMMSLTGQTVWSGRATGNRTRMDLGQLPAGIYLLRIATRDGLHHERIVKAD